MSMYEDDLNLPRRNCHDDKESVFKLSLSLSVVPICHLKKKKKTYSSARSFRRRGRTMLWNASLLGHECFATELDP